MAETDTDFQKELDNVLTAGPQLGGAQVQEQFATMPFQALLAQQLGGFVPGQLTQDFDTLSQFSTPFQNLFLTLEEQEQDRRLSQTLKRTPTVGDIDAARRGETDQAIRDELSAQTLAEVQAGGTLTEQEQRNVEQQQRSAEASRGISSGQGSANREAVDLALSSRQLQDQRQSDAQDFLGFQHSTSTDPFAAILGLPTSATDNSLLFTQNPGLQPAFAGAPTTGQASAFNVGNLSQGQQTVDIQGASLDDDIRRTNLAVDIANKDSANKGGVTL